MFSCSDCVAFELVVLFYSLYRLSSFFCLLSPRKILYAIIVKPSGKNIMHAQPPSCLFSKSLEIIRIFMKGSFTRLKNFNLLSRFLHVLVDCHGFINKSPEAAKQKRTRMVIISKKFLNFYNYSKFQLNSFSSLLLQ